MLKREGIGSSWPNLAEPGAPDHNAKPRSDVVGKTARRTNVTWKRREDLEADFWTKIRDAQDTLRKPKNTPEFERKALQLAAELENIFGQLRVSVRAMPADIRQAADRYISALNEQTTAREDLQSQHDSSSSRQSSVSVSSSASRRAELKAKAASLEAKKEAKKIEAARQTELARLEAEENARRAMFESDLQRRKRDLEYLELENMIKVTQREMQVLDEELGLTDQPAADITPIQAQNPQSPRRSVETPVRHDNKTDNLNVGDLLEAFNQSMSRSRLPVPEPPTFNGDPMKFPVWKAAFSTLIESKDIPSSEKLHYLQSYLSGEARECVEGLFYFDTEEAYESAWDKLEKRYGNEFLIAEAFRQKLHLWPEIENTDYKNLQKYADFLSQCAVAKQHVFCLDILDDCHENKKLMEKLPKWCRREWTKKVADRGYDVRRYPQFDEFVDFVIRLAERVNNPILADVQPSPSKPQKKIAKTLRTTSEMTPPKPRELVTPKNCDFCQLTNHILHNCRKFRALTPAQRETFIMKNGLCFSCLSKGHVSRLCPNKSKCSSCGNDHPTCLHGDYDALHPSASSTPRDQTALSTSERPHQDQSTPTSISGKTASINLSTSGNVQTQGRSSAIVPVYLSTVESPDEEKIVYAMLDSQSDSTFVLDDTVSEMNTSSTPVKLKISTMTSTSTMDCRRYCGLQVRGLNSKEKICLPPTYSRNFIPTNKDHIPTPAVAEKWKHLRTLKDKIPPPQDCEVALLIGYDCPRALAPLQVIVGLNDEPFGQCTALGWSIVGRTFSQEANEEDSCQEVHIVQRTKITDVTNSEILRVLESDFPEKQPDDSTKCSQEDLRFLNLMENGIRQDNNGYYEMPLPFKSERPELPKNKLLAEKRLSHLTRKFQRDGNFYEKYKKFMNDILDREEAEEVLEPEKEACWYIPHHGVFHPKKNKLRVVFDCSAQYRGTSLNQHLLQGPDQMNALVGVLCRFREKPIAVTSDIERMFHQFRVREEDRNFLCFLWWKDGDISGTPKTYRMKVHLFGATSSPGCAIYGLKTLAKEHGTKLSPEVADFITRDFYVDDGLMSCKTVEEATTLVKQARETCSKANVRLHKFLSNNEEVMKSIPPSERCQDASSVDFNFNTLSLERVLGVQWCVKSDQFQFRLMIPGKPLTRRGILATIGSVYDPLGIISPFVLLGKRILQQMCSENCGWDDTISETLRPHWEHWLSELPKLEELQIPRCLSPFDPKKIKTTEIHHFSDASTIGYGQCSYLRQVSTEDEVSCRLVMGKSRVVPLKPMTIPRLELTAAVTSAKISKLLRKEMTCSDVKEYFWTDSKIALGYIQNDARKFHVYVSNRVQTIRNLSDPEQWFYISTHENPADHASRGLAAKDLLNSNWLTGPTFLHQREVQFPKTEQAEVSSEDPELKKEIQSLVTQTKRTVIQRLEKFSRWTSVVKAIAVIKRFLQHKTEPLQEQDRRQAASTIWKLQQAEAFEEEIRLLKNSTTLPRGNRLEKLDPFIAPDGLLRVGGRLKRANFDEEVKHPIILPRGPMTQLLIADSHERVAHQGRGLTINELRSRGFWILGCSGAVSSYIHRCVTCRKLRGTSQQQKMADLPEDRVECSAPFTYCGLDCFGPFLAKDGRRQLKRYGLIVTCMASRAIHIELLDDMSTDAFINALRCVIAIRGPIRQIRCDQGTNFVGAKRELNEALKEIKDDQVREYLSKNNCDFLFNSPSSSHMGGVWERHIRTIRSILNTLLEHHGTFDTSTLRTFFYEAMAIINCRPLTYQNLNDPCGPEPLTPNHLLTSKTKIVMPPPGEFVKEDLFARKRWRRTQYLVNTFWSRWRKEYLLTQQTRVKWKNARRNITVGDVILLQDEGVRGQWILARVIDTITDADGLTRRVKIQLATTQLNRDGKRQGKPVVLERPIQKLILLVESE